MVQMEWYFIPCGRVLTQYDALCSVYIYRSTNSIDRCFIKTNYAHFKSQRYMNMPTQGKSYPCLS